MLPKYLEHAETFDSERAEYAEPKHCNGKTTLKVAVSFLQVTRMRKKEKRQYQGHVASTRCNPDANFSDHIKSPISMQFNTSAKAPNYHFPFCLKAVIMDCV